eukprot:COSAG03_NODE_3715_length_1863_cov_1.657596_2_plen_34_part_01
MSVAPGGMGPAPLAPYASSAGIVSVAEPPTRILH